MTDAERRKLRGHYLSLSRIEGNLREAASRGVTAVDGDVGDTIAEEVDRLETEFPALGPPARVRDVRQRRDRPFYLIQPILTKVSLVVGRISAALEEADSTPVTETRECKFVRDNAMRTILERDYLEIQRAYVARCWKSAIILAGGAIEASLLDLALQDPTKAKSSPKAPNQSDLTRWDLRDLISVCVDLKLVSSGVERLSSQVREYRNLVHPGNEHRTNMVFGAEEARIALEVLSMVHRDLS